MAPRLRVAFAGTPEFARVALAAICDAGFDLPLVLTQPDRPAGRGLQLSASAVKQFAVAERLSLAQPRSLRLDGKYPQDAAAARDALLAAAPDVMVVAAYGLILPAWMLALPRLGCLNIHGSLLPRWRGAAPIQRAIEAGDVESGITLMQMDEGLDTGAMLLAEASAIRSDDTAGSVHDRLAAMGARLCVQALHDAAAERLRPVPQPADGANYAPKIDKAEASLDWSQPAALLERRVRAFDPAPGCSFEAHGQRIKVWRARVVESSDAEVAARVGTQAGTRVHTDDPTRWIIGCSEGALELLEVQPPGGKRITVAELLRRQPAVAAP